MNIIESKQIDPIEDVMERARQNHIYCSDCVEDEIEEIKLEIERKKEEKRMLGYKMYQIENVKKYGTAKVPQKFKKVEDIIKDEKNIDRFYYNLFFYGFVDYKDGIGYLLPDNTNFYLKFTTYSDTIPINTGFQEELYITENKAREVLIYDVIVDEIERQSLEASP